MNSSGLMELVTDKGYHSNEIVTDLAELGVRSYICEPNRGRRNWTDKDKQRDAVYANRRRIRGDRGKRLLRQRGVMLERPFAHCYETGGMRRLHLRGRENILKRLLIHVGGFNLSLVLRQDLGKGTPRGLQDLAMWHLKSIIGLLKLLSIDNSVLAAPQTLTTFAKSFPTSRTRRGKTVTTSTGC